MAVEQVKRKVQDHSMSIVIANKFRICKKLGKGSFGVLY